MANHPGQPFFISGIGTGVGKTLVSAVITQALGAAYWKPVQAGFADGTDSELVAGLVTDPAIRVLPESYRLQLPASPHIAAREEGKTISLEKIAADFAAFPPTGGPIVIEGAGGLLVPLNDHEFVIDLVRRLDARLILVSRNYLGSINHSLLTAAKCREAGIDVAGWVFNDQYLDYAAEIARWTEIPLLFSLPAFAEITRETVRMAANAARPALLPLL